MSRPVEKTGGLVDFKENIVFEEFKDKHMNGINHLKKEVTKRYGFVPSSALYRKIVNYQIEKYGAPLCNTNDIEYIPYLGQKSRKQRRLKNDIKNAKDKLERFIKRNEK